MTAEDALSTAPLLPGQRLGEFELLGLVSRGGMGEIWLGRTPESETLFAVKTLLPNLVDAPKMRLMFVEETRIAAQLVHPNVVRVVDVGEPIPVPYYAMEWVDGAPLDDLFSAAAALAKTVKVDGASQGRMSAAMRAAENDGADENASGRLPVGVLVHIVLEAAYGLHAAHELRDADGNLRDVVHRDVSPSNVLVGRDGVSKITDFGIARARGRLAKTTTGGFRGKLAYVSPEQALAREVDRRADVWGLGAVLYEGLAGHPPYQGRDEASILAQLVTGPPQLVFESDVPRPLVAVLRRAMAHAPAARYPTAEAFARDLAAARDALGIGVSAREVAAEVEARVGASLRARTERLLRGSTSNRNADARRPSWRLVASIAVVAVAVGGVVVAEALGRMGPRPPPSAKFGLVDDPALIASAIAAHSAALASAPPDAGPAVVDTSTTPATAASAVTASTLPDAGVLVAATKADAGSRGRGHGARDPSRRDTPPKPPRPAPSTGHVDPDDPGW